MTIEFRDLPPDGRGSKTSTKWGRIAEACKARPGEWCYVGDYASSSAVKHPQTRGLRTTTRTRDDRRFDIYVMWPKEDEK